MSGFGTGFAVLIPDVLTVLETSEGGNLLWLLALGPAGAVGTYWAFYRYYRNTDKSHHYERDTLIEAQPVEGSERKVKHIRKTRQSRMSGTNHTDHRKRVKRLG